MSSEANPVTGRLLGRYLVVGIWNTIFGLAVFALLWWSIGARVGYVGTLLATQPIAVVQAHGTQRRFVWGSRSPYLAELWRFSVVYSLGLAANIALLAVAVEALSLPVLPSQVAVTAVIIVGQFTAQRLWAFRSRARQAG